jgi:hypothetical protein
MEMGFYGFDAVRQDCVDPSSMESISTVSGKLQSFCPVFFNTLSVWERDVINSSAWLKSVTTKICSPPSAVKGNTGDTNLSSGNQDPLPTSSDCCSGIGASDCH